MKSNLLILFAAVLVIAGCKKESKNAPKLPTLPEDEIVRIPVVVHVLYAHDEFNISDEKIASQIAILNQDFRKLNPDHTKTPAEFAHLVADVGIEFDLAQVDPTGKPTTGITRTYTQVSGFDGLDITGQTSIEHLKLYHTSKGGQDAWPRDKYLNIWVTELSDRHGNMALAGHAQLPGADARIDGVIIDPRAFGTLPPLDSKKQLGRTATHEVGHWLNLIHIFGNGFGCESTDLVDDTPSASTSYEGNPPYPQVSCGRSNMFMNFIDLVNDEAMYMFTKGQRVRMRAVFAEGGGRQNLYNNISHHKLYKRHVRSTPRHKCNLI